MSGVNRFEAHYLTEGVMGGKALARAEMILASDYDRDIQALKERADAEQEAYDGQRRILDSVKAERDTFKFECVNLNNILNQIRIERDALRAQVEAMRTLLTQCHAELDQYWSPKLRADIEAALQEDKP